MSSIWESNLKWRFIVSAVLLFWHLGADPSRADFFQLEKVVDNNTTVPGDARTFDSFFKVVALSQRNLAFIAVSYEVGGLPRQEGVYKVVDGIVSKIADLDTAVPAGTGTFSDFVVGSLASLGSNDVVFIANGSAGEQGIYAERSGILHKVADLDTILPGEATATFTSFFEVISLGSMGNLAFRARSNLPGSPHGIYKEVDGVLSKVVDWFTTFPPGTMNQPFAPFIGPPSAVGERDLVFRAGGSFDSGIYAFINDELKSIANFATPIPEGTGNFTSLNGDPVGREDGGIVFRGKGSAEQAGLYGFMDGQLRKLLDKNTPIPGGVGSFASFFPPPSLRGVAFSATGDVYQDGLYAILDGSISRVVDRATPIPDGFTNFIGSFSPNVSIGDGDLSFIFTQRSGALRVSVGQGVVNAQEGIGRTSPV